MSEAARILIVDDEPNVRLVFRTALLANNHTLSSAEDGDSALRLLAEERFDLVLLDLQMPGLSGLDLLRKLRELKNDVPAVFITAHGRIPDAVEAMKLGAIDFLAKPITPDALRKVVAEVLMRNRPVPVRPAENPNRPDSENPAAPVLRDAKSAINRRDFRVADELLRRAIALNSRSPEALNLLGVLHEVRRDREASRLSYRAALQADRNYEPARRNLWRLYEKTRFGRSEIPVSTGEESEWVEPKSPPNEGDR